MRFILKGKNNLMAQKEKKGVKATKAGGKGYIKSLDDIIGEIDSDLDPISVSSFDKEIDRMSKKSGDTYGKALFIRFYLDDILLAIPLDGAVEIGHRPNITFLPNLPEWVLGVSNIRGEIVSVVSLKAFFGLPTRGKRGRRFIIIKSGEIKVGVVVDRITGIYSLDTAEEPIKENPFLKHEIARYISGVVSIEEELMNILDVDKLLNSSKMDAFKGE